jgi:hypothetical protein
MVRARRVDVSSIGNASSLPQFLRKRSGSTLEVNRDIRDMFGATLEAQIGHIEPRNQQDNPIYGVIDVDIRPLVCVQQHLDETHRVSVV